MTTTPSKRHISGAGAFIGETTLKNGEAFDFEEGSATSNLATADVWMEWRLKPQELNSRPPSITLYIRPVNGAALYPMAYHIKPAVFDQLSVADLQTLPYSTLPYSEANLGPKADRVQWAVFAVRTRNINTHINFTKVHILEFRAWSPLIKDISNLSFRWATYTEPIHFLDVRVTLGSTPTWLVTRYVVQCTHNTPNGIRICAKGTYGPEGGILQGQISDETGTFPSSIVVTVSIDFQPGTKLNGLVKTFVLPVTDTGVNFLFEPFQVMQKTNVLLDLRPAPKTGDYLVLEWQHHNSTGMVVASGQKYIPGDELREQVVAQYEIVFVPDPIAAKDLNIQITGLFQGKALPQFDETFELADKAVLIRAQNLSSGRGYRLVSV